MTDTDTIIDMLREGQRRQEASAQRIEDALVRHAEDDAKSFEKLEQSIAEINAWRNRSIGVVLVGMAVLGVLAPAIGSSVGIT